MIEVYHSHSVQMLSVDSCRSMIWTSFAVLIKSLKMVMNFSPKDNWSHFFLRPTTVASSIMQVL